MGIWLFIFLSLCGKSLSFQNQNWNQNQQSYWNRNQNQQSYRNRNQNQQSHQNQCRQTYQPISGFNARFEKTCLSHDTFKFKPFSNSNQRQLTFRQFLNEIESKSQLLDDFINVLSSGTDYNQYYFECPPITQATLDTPFEFILKRTYSLDRESQDTFREYFQPPQCLSVAFPTPRRDSTLISPCPPIGNLTREETRDYVHLASFMKNGPMNKKKDLLARSARVLINKMDTTTDPWWFSTAGNGVAWLHIRIDSRPKYYRHNPYKSSPVDANSNQGAVSPNQASNVPSVANGCPRERNQTITSRRYGAAVRCCSPSTCVSPGHPNRQQCNSNMYVSFTRAEEICGGLGMTLCTSDELSSNKCCRSGCGFDQHLVWLKREESSNSDTSSQTSGADQGNCQWSSWTPQTQCDQNTSTQRERRNCINGLETQRTEHRTVSCQHDVNNVDDSQQSSNNQHHQSNNQHNQSNNQNHQSNNQHHQSNNQHHQSNNQHHQSNGDHTSGGNQRHCQWSSWTALSSCNLNSCTQQENRRCHNGLETVRTEHRTTQCCQPYHQSNSQHQQSNNQHHQSTGSHTSGGNHGHQENCHYGQWTEWTPSDCQETDFGCHRRETRSCVVNSQSIRQDVRTVPCTCRTGGVQYNNHRVGTIEKVKLSIRESQYCGGNKAYVTLNQGGIFCSTKTILDFDEGETLQWTGHKLGRCGQREFDPRQTVLDFQVKSKTTNQFCPKTITITMNGREYTYNNMRDIVSSRRDGPWYSAYITQSD